LHLQYGASCEGNHVLATVEDCSLRLQSQSHVTEAWCRERFGLVDIPTVEKPVCLMLSGNDDTSYSAFFANVDQAQLMLNSVTASASWHCIGEFGFVFTN